MRYGELPKGAVEYSRTKTFTNETVPKALLKDHATKSGAWGLIHAVKGTVTYHLSDGFTPPVHLVAGDEKVVTPQARHFVRLAPNSAFYVAFYSLSE